MKYFGKAAADDQKTLMLRGELRCNDHDNKKVSEQLFKINQDLKLLNKDIDKFSICKMAKLVIPKNLKYPAKLKSKVERIYAMRKQSLIFAVTSRKCQTSTARKTDFAITTVQLQIKSHQKKGRDTIPPHAESTTVPINGRIVRTIGITKTPTPTTFPVLPTQLPSGTEIFIQA